MREFDPSTPSIIPVDQAFATTHVDELLALARQIPEAPWTAEDIVGTRKADGRIEYAKWQHTFALMQGEAIAGFVMAYERAAESNANYPINSLYITGLAVRPESQRQGYARQLMRAILEPVLANGFSELSGPTIFTLQTNAADWNVPVRTFYESLGFRVVGSKQYDNRTDVVMLGDEKDVRAALQSRE